MARVLVVEDEADMRHLLEFNLRQAGHDVTSADSGTEGLAAARSRPFDLILLDIMLPGQSGLAVCKTLRVEPATSHVPIMMLTAKGEEIDRVLGFELGADDYIVKPFSMRELMLRIESVLKRHRANITFATSTTFGVLRMDVQAHRAWVREHPVDLTALEFKLLTVLYERRGRVQSRMTLLSDVWNIYAEVNTRTVDTHVKRLREKMGDAGHYIETVRGVGYRFADAP